MVIRAVFFDIDGTLVDSNDLHADAWVEGFRHFGFEFDRQRVRDQIGKGGDMLIPSLLPDLDERRIEEIAHFRGELFKRDYIDRVQAFPGARDLLQRAKEDGKRVVLASSAKQEELEHHIDLLDCRELLDAATTADDVERSKPAKDIFATALDKVAPLGPAEVLVVGDTPYDIEAAAKCGIGTIAVRSGGFREEMLRKAGAIALYDGVAALLAGYEASPLGRSIRSA